MKKPLRAPLLQDLFDRHREDIGDILTKQIGATLNGEYVHWDKLRHLQPPEGLNHEQWWLGIKLARSSSRRFLSLTDVGGRLLSVALTPEIQEALHEIDSRGAGRIAMPEPVTNPATRARFLVRSLIEEAITSSQLEGASTTRKKAMEMIRSGRVPADKSEQMILNNLHGMEFIQEHQKDDLTPELVLEIHRRLTHGTISSNSVGCLQSPSDDRVRVVSNATGEILHEPPPAELLPLRLKRMCDFANGYGENEFLHPVLRAIILHFWLGYDHPFEDGNGRTARALFYWSMLHQGYWLFEFISISTILRRASAQYGRSFLYTETDDFDATYFVSYQLSVIRRSLKGLEGYLEKKTREIHAAEDVIRGSGSYNYRQLALLSHALRNLDAEYTIRAHRVSHNVSQNTSRTDLMELQEKGLLEKRTIGNTAHFFVGERLRKLMVGA